MKKLYLLLIAIFLLIVSSCNQDLLEIEQKGAMELIPFYKNADDEDAESLIAAVQKCFYTDVHNTSYIFPMNLLSDDHYCGGNSFADCAVWRPFGYYKFTAATPAIKTLYTGLYKINYWCNLIVEYLPDNSDTKNRIIAEAKFYRALCNIYLIRIWGTPPYIPSSGTTTTPPNGDPDELWAWVEQNLTEAAAVLPSKSGLYDQISIGDRPTREAALAYLGKAQVLQGKFSAASTNLWDVISSGKYALIEDMSILFHHEADFCEEYIFEFNAENDAATGSSQNDLRGIQLNWRYTNIASPTAAWGTGWGFGQSPTLEFVEFAQQHEVLSESTYSKRYHNTIISYEDILKLDYPDGITPGIKASAQYVTDNIGYWGWRYFLPKSDVIDGTDKGTASARSHANTPFMRYADVLLLFAEAEVQQNRQTGNGLDALNEVRIRAGLPALSSMTLQNVKDERRIEFWGEGERYLDLVRWGDAATMLADPNKYRYQFNGLNSDNSYNVSSDGIVYGLGFTKGTHEHWPFPETELLANPNLVQNTGY
jgi:hypothetical protein